MEEVTTNLESARFEDRGTFLIVGMSERYNNHKIEGIPAQWQRFAPHIGKIPGQAGWTAYGVCCNFDGAGNMDYICGVEVSDSAVTPEGLTKLQVDAQTYAVFRHDEHISKIGRTWEAIFKQGLPMSGHKPLPAPQLEVYGPNFNPQTGMGGVEIWIPVER